MKLQQPRNHDFRVSQFNPPRPRSGNNQEMTTSPPGLGHRWPSTGVKKASSQKTPKKVWKGFPGPLGPGSKQFEKVEKYSQTSEKPPKETEKLSFRIFIEFFLALGPRGPGTPLSDFFRSLVEGQRCPNTWPSLRGRDCTHNDCQTTTIASQQPRNDDFCRILQRPRNATTAKCNDHEMTS